MVFHLFLQVNYYLSLFFMDLIVKSNFTFMNNHYLIIVLSAFFVSYFWEWLTFFPYSIEQISFKEA